jgi:hypothetical protein
MAVSICSGGEGAGLATAGGAGAGAGAGVGGAADATGGAGGTGGVGRTGGAALLACGGDGGRFFLCGAGFAMDGARFAPPF